MASGSAGYSEEVLALVDALRHFPKHEVMYPGQLTAATGINLAGRADLLDALSSHPRVVDHGGAGGSSNRDDVPHSSPLTLQLWC